MGQKIERGALSYCLLGVGTRLIIALALPDLSHGSLIPDPVQADSRGVQVGDVLGSFLSCQLLVVHANSPRLFSEELRKAHVWSVARQSGHSESTLGLFVVKCSGCTQEEGVMPFKVKV